MRPASRSFVRTMTYDELNAMSDARNGQVNPPKDAILTYSICGPDDNACGWEGWLLECASIRTVSAKGEDIVVFVPTASAQVCPNCRNTLYRTDSKFKLSLHSQVP